MSTADTPRTYPDLTFDQIMGACNEFQRHHLEWPTSKATAEQFKEARVLMDGISGLTLNVMLKNPSEKLKADPKYQEMRKLLFRVSNFWDVDLSFINPKKYMQMPPDDLARLIDSVGGGVRQAHTKDRPAASYGLWLPNQFVQRIAEKAGLDYETIQRRAFSIDSWLPSSPEVQEFLTRSHAYYGPQAFDSYFFEILDNDRIYMKYQTILGSRYVGEMTPELWEKLENKLAETVRTAVQEKPPVSGGFKVDLTKKEAPKALSVGEELALMIPKDGVLALPKQQLAHYQEIKAMLEKAGGSYVSNKKVFKFENGIDAADIQQRLLDGEAINFQQQWQFFATPKEEVVEMCGEIPRIQGARVLEPSAGDGAIAVVARAQGAREVVTVEAWNVNAAKLREKGFDPIERDFLSITPQEIGTFDVILANPPFTKNQDIDHVMHMLNFLRPGGSLSAIMSPAWVTGSHKKHVAFREFLKSQDVEVNSIEAGAFSSSGTSIGTMRVTIPAYRPVMREGMAEDTALDQDEDVSEAPSMG